MPEHGSVATAAARVEVLPINGNIGAELRGVDLARELSEPEFRAVHDALIEHEVIVMREQEISLEQQIAFARRFGELSIHPFSPNLEDKPEVIVLDYSADNPPALTDCWHADETFREAPPMATVLRAKVVPAKGGDTLFASMTAAYRGLSERMKQYLHGLEALHDFKPFRTLFGDSPGERAKLRRLEDQFPNPWHPVVARHPVSGKPVLYVNPQFTLRIRGVKDDESRAMLEFLYEQAHVPEYQLRVRWRPHTVVMWDNRSVQHYAVHDYSPQRRTMERVTVKGRRPRGVSGAYVSGTLAQAESSRSGAAAKRPVRPFERG